MKNTSKILALVLIVMTILMSLTAITASAADSTRVYCNNEAGWSNVYCYFWNNSGNGGAWPGKAMTYDETLGLYYYDIPAGYVNVIFNGGNGKPQSADLTVPTDDKVVYNNAVKGWGVLGGVAEEPEVTTVYVKNTANWSTVYCYACTDGWAAETAWPGNAMTYDESLGLWKYDVLDGYVRLIFNGGNGKPQSADLTTPTTDAVVFDNGAGTWGTIDGETVVVAPKFIIAGSDSTGAASIFGTAWDTANEANLMTLDEETGVHTIVYDNVPAGSYKFKATRDNSWTSPIGDPNSGDPDGNYLLTVAGLSKVTISCKDGDTKLTVKVESLHTHSWSDATCTEPQKCECGETQGEALGHTWADATCTAPKTCSVCSVTEGEALGHTWADATCTAPKTCSVCSATEGEALGHTFVEGKCACGAADPDYVAPLPEGTYVLESSKLDAAAAGDFADGTVVKVDDYFSLILGTKSKIDSSSKTWKEEDWGELAYKSGQRLYLGGKTSTTANAIVFTTSKAATVTVWWVSNGEPNEDGTGSRPVGILDSEGNVLVQDTTGVAKNALHISTFEIPAAGTYYLGNMVDNNYFFKVQVVEKEVEVPHVNTLVVGDTNKIVIDDDQDNGWGYYIELVPFAVEEAGYYTFAGEGLTIWIYDANSTLLSMTGAANLEPGYYGIFIAANTVGTTGTYNVAVTKAAWVNALVEGATSKINITDALNNGAGYYITWVPFEVKEAGHYAFTGTDAVAWIFTADYTTLLCGMSGAADLQPGTYQICVAPLAKDTTGMFNITVTKTAIEGGDPVDPPVETPTHEGEQVFVVGENKVIIDGCTLNLVGAAVEMVKFEVTDKAKYIFVSDINTYISTSSDASDLTGYLGGAFVEEGILEPGTYYICCGNSGELGEFSVTVVKETLDENCEHEWTPATCTTPKTCGKCGETVEGFDPEVHATFADTCLLCGKDVPSFKVGDNTVVYVPGAPNLMSNGDLYAKIEITEPGRYVITGGAAEKIKVYVWSVPTSDLEKGQLTMDTPYAVNIDVMAESGLADYFVIDLPEAGVYWIGFAFDLRGEGHEGCEFNVNISLHDEHEYVEGKCEVCGEEEPVVEEPGTDEEPGTEKPAELSFIQKIIRLIKELLAKFLGFFKRFGI